jgi:hypothetical protein
MYQSTLACELSVMVKNHDPASDFFKSRLWEWMRTMYPTSEDCQYLEFAVRMSNTNFLDSRLVHTLSIYHRFLHLEFPKGEFPQRPTEEQMQDIANSLWSMTQWRYLPLLIHHERSITREMIRRVQILDHTEGYIPFPCNDTTCNKKVKQFIQDKLNNTHYYFDILPLELLEMICIDIETCKRIASISLKFEIKHYNNPNSLFWKHLIRQNVREFDSPEQFNNYMAKLNLHGQSYKQLFERISIFKTMGNISDLMRYGAIKIIEHYQDTLINTNVTTLIFYFNYAAKYNYTDLIHTLISINEMRSEAIQISPMQLAGILQLKTSVAEMYAKH